MAKRSRLPHSRTFAFGLGRPVRPPEATGTATRDQERSQRFVTGAKVQVAGGMQQDGVEVGNAFDKYGSRNPLVRLMMHGFHAALDDFVRRAAPCTLHEVGCGEGYWVLQWHKAGIAARGSDFSTQVIAIAQQNAEAQGAPPGLFTAQSVYTLTPERDGADLIVCCEVLEHLERPADGLQALQRIARDYVIVSVPREPIWRALNLARGKYARSLGNTPGHIQHWSRRSFVALVSQYFDVVAVRTPLPWTMLLCRVRR